MAIKTRIAEQAHPVGIDTCPIHPMPDFVVKSNSTNFPWPFSTMFVELSE